MYTTAIGLPTFSLVKSNMRWPPTLLSAPTPSGVPFCGSKPRGRVDQLVARGDHALVEQDRHRLAVRAEFACGSRRARPAARCRLRPRRTALPSTTARYSSVAVAPRMRLACAVSCTPGSCTTMRSLPWRWMIGSATPSCVDAVAQRARCSARSPRRRCAAVRPRRACATRSSAALAVDSSQVRLARGDQLARAWSRVRGAASAWRRCRCRRGARPTRSAMSFVAQQHAQVLGGGVQPLVERGLLVDLHQEVHAALQVEAEQHRLARRSSRSQSGTVEARFSATDVVAAELVAQRVGGLDLLRRGRPGAPAGCPSSSSSIALGAMPAFFSVPATRVRSASSTVAPRLAVTCTAGILRDRCWATRTAR